MKCLILLSSLTICFSCFTQSQYSDRILDTITHAENNIIETWELDVMASIFKPGTAWKQQTRSYTFTSDYKYVRMQASGKRENNTDGFFQYAAAYDRKDYPVSGNLANEMVSLERPGKNALIIRTKIDGKIIETSNTTISSDGLTMIINCKSMDKSGTTSRYKLVFRRQFYE